MAPPGFNVTIEKNMPLQVRDGTILRSDIYRPDSPGRFATLLSRTPYDKSRHTDTYLQLAERGYVVVVQDVRGRYASDGKFMPGFYSASHCDTEDGYDSVEWSASLPWSSGKVGTIGGSYVGWTQWELAHARPPHLVTIMPQAISANLLDREMSGVLRLGRVLWWTLNTLSPDLRFRAQNFSGPRNTDEAERLWSNLDRSKWLWFLPLMEIPDAVMFGMGYHWRNWLENHTTDHFGFLKKHSSVDVPALITTGWYDQQIGAIKHFTGMRSNAATKVAQTQTKLIVGPWTHAAFELSGKVGEIDFGTEATIAYLDLADDWFSYFLKGENNGVLEWPAVRIFVMGANKWRNFDNWPIPGTTYRQLYLTVDGTLTWNKPNEGRPDQYIYDPRDPVMTLYTAEGQQEPQDLRILDGRSDILTYSTTPLENPVEIIGPVTMNLWASSSAKDTDFIVRLVDVWPNGFAQELSYGIVRARYRDSIENPSLIKPDKPYEYTIELNPTANLFKHGHKIRVDVCSSDFPNFDRNHNTGGNDYAESTLQKACQTIFHDLERPSRITLPIVSQ